MSTSTSGMGTAALRPHQHSLPQVSKKGFPKKPHTLQERGSALPPGSHAPTQPEQLE